MSRPPLDSLDSKRIAIVKLSALGDVVHSLPVLNALRHRFPTAKISWVINRVYAPLLACHPDLDETIPFDRAAWKRGWSHGWQSMVEMGRQLRRRRFDLVIDLQCLFRSGLITAATGCPRRVGLEPTREGSRLFYTDVIPVSDGPTLHAVDRYWHIASAFGCGDIEKSFTLRIDPDSARWAKQMLADCPRPWMAFAVGSRWLTKRWPAASFAELARRAQQNFGGTVLFVGTADERPLSQEVTHVLTGPTRDFTGRTTLPELAAILDSVDVTVANDTGPLHLAAALGSPVTAPYTCTQVRRHGPYSQFGNSVETKVWCRGSYLKKCDRLECMSELHPDRLWPILQENLKRWSRNSRSA